MDYQQIALEVFNNKLSYKDDDYIVILNILMESYNKSKGIPYEVQYDLKQEVALNECECCGVDMSDVVNNVLDNGLCENCGVDEYDIGRCERCESLGIMMYGDDLCNGCVDQDSEYDD